MEQEKVLNVHTPCLSYLRDVCGRNSKPTISNTNMTAFTVVSSQWLTYFNLNSLHTLRKNMVITKCHTPEGKKKATVSATLCHYVVRPCVSAQNRSQQWCWWWWSLSLSGTKKITLIIDSLGVERDDFLERTVWSYLSRY